MRPIAVAVVLLLAAGCASEPVNVAPTPPAGFQRLGPASGEGCGSLGVVFNWLYFVPMSLNSRVERAYQAALASVPGATGLINVVYQEDWNWWFIGTERCVRISGEAIR